jgi:acetyl-CoA carboxylase carboxyltransferase component
MSIENVTQAKAVISATEAYKTLTAFFDADTFVSVDTLAKSKDTYAEVVAGFGTVEGLPVYAFAQNSDFCGGAMSKAQATKIKKVYDLALKTGTPVVAFYNSKGGRLDENNALLAGYGEVLNSASKLSGVVPQVSVILGPCVGTGALNAVSADFVIMSKDAQLSLDTLGSNSSAEYNAKNGVVSIVVDDAEKAIEKAKELICYLPSNNLNIAPEAVAEEPEAEGGCIVHRVADAGTIFKLSTEFGEAGKTVFIRVGGQVAGVVNTKDTLKADDCIKISKFVRFCDAFSIPVITFVNTDGFEDIKSAVKVTSAYAEATTVKISVVTGKAYGAGYIALAGTGANADVVYALPEAVVSPVNPEAATLIMAPEKMNVPVSEQAKAVEAFAKENLSAENAANCGYIDDVITTGEVRTAVVNALDMLMGKRVSTLAKKHSTI